MRVARRSESQNFQMRVGTQNSNRNPTLSGQRIGERDPWEPTVSWGGGNPHFLLFSLFVFPGFVLEANPSCGSVLLWWQCWSPHCGGAPTGGADTWTLSVWLVEPEKGIPLCEECRRKPHYFFLAASPWGWLQWHRIVRQCGGGGRAKSLRKIHFSGQRNWKRGILGARECGENPREKRIGKRNPSNSVYELTQILGSPPSCAWAAQTQKEQSKISENWAVIQTTPKSQTHSWVTYTGQ